MHSARLLDMAQRTYIDSLQLEEKLEGVHAAVTH
jgi:hypothetical protein